MYSFDKSTYEKRKEYISHFIEKINIMHIPQSVLLEHENKHRLSFIVSSNAIEGNTFTIDETKKLLDKNIVTEKRSFLEHQQITNYHNAYNEMLSLSAQGVEISVELICTLHSLVCAGEIKSAGDIRETNVYVGNDSQIIHNPPDYSHVRDLLETLIKNYYISIEEPLKNISHFHLEFERIHPFEDGNGRVGRLLINYQLLQYNYFQLHIPNNKRSLYMSAFKDYNRNGKTEKMLDIISREEEKTIQNIDQLWSKFKENKKKRDELSR